MEFATLGFHWYLYKALQRTLERVFVAGAWNMIRALSCAIPG